MRPMRRKASQLSDADTRDILQNGVWGTLATVDGDGQPYAVPLNYVLVDTTLYIHSAHEGHKIDNLRECPKVSFAVVASEKMLADKFDTQYRSAILFGTARLVTDPEEKQAALEALMNKYSASFHDKAMEYIRKNSDRTTVAAINVVHATGKEGK
ncbi:hypothetical protein McpSp1_05650 [Methanocorpusculaceae archaeon Sp1]|uniref:MFS transporter n=1 Tax=Methanorbis furvi TaxID=3028299 RepID=A0AAE4S9S3_9EURY|nr:hypothetical protein [Methanocorpusculaceae archaeon Sp1]MDV0442157.1 hypothetical protein [Methanocorpusculaceae archaeon Ag1]